MENVLKSDWNRLIAHLDGQWEFQIWPVCELTKILLDVMDIPETFIQFKALVLEQ